MPPMSKINDTDVYVDALDKAIAELTEVMAEREALDEKMEAATQRILRLRRGALGLGALCGNSPGELSSKFPDLFPDSIDPDTGLTDAVREVLKTDTHTYFSPVNVRDRLRGRGYDISKYKNVLASIHTILKRLKDQDEVKDVNRDGRTVYKWIVREVEEAAPF
jgi:hypothetical protein